MYVVHTAMKRIFVGASWNIGIIIASYAFTHILKGVIIRSFSKCKLVLSTNVDMAVVVVLVVPQVENAMVLQKDPQEKLFKLLCCHRVVRKL